MNSYIQLFNQLKSVNARIQDCTVDYKSLTPYYLITEELKVLYKLLDIKSGNASFDKSIDYGYLEHNQERLMTAEMLIPQHVIDKGDKLWYMEKTLEQLKEASSKSLKHFKTSIYCCQLYHKMNCDEMQALIRL